MEHHHAINGKTHYKWQFSIAMLVYQRGKNHCLKLSAANVIKAELQRHVFVVFQAELQRHLGLSENVGLIFPMK